MSVIFAFDGVLATDDLSPLEGQRAIYESFRQDNPMVVLSTNSDKEAVRSFLRDHHYRYDMLLTKERTSALDDVAWKVTSVRNVRAMGWPVLCYLDNDPEAIRRVFADGVVCLLLVHRLVRPEWLPDGRQPRAWEELVGFIEQQHRREAPAEPEQPRPWQRPVVR